MKQLSQRQIRNPNISSAESAENKSDWNWSLIFWSTHRALSRCLGRCEWLQYPALEANKSSFFLL